jgi:RHS repeat-associated protein
MGGGMPERPGPWELLDQPSDPVVADLPEVNARLAYFRSLAEAMRTEGQRLSQIASGQSLTGQYADKMRSSAGTVSKDLDQVVGRYEAVVQALTGYEPALDTALTGSAQALDDAIDANSAVLAAALMPSATAPPGGKLTPQQEEDNTDKTNAANAAAARMDAARQKLAGVLSALNEAGQAAAATIQAGFNDGLTDSAWDRFKYAFQQFLQILVKILTYVGMALAVIAMVIPGLGQLALAAGLAIGAVTLAADIGLKALGGGSWADIGLAIAGLVTFGAAKILGPAISAGAKAITSAIKGADTAAETGSDAASGIADEAGDLGSAGESGPTRDATLVDSDSDSEVGDAHQDGSSGAVGEPVDVVTGEMFLPQRDLSLPGVLPLVLERHYGSAYRYGGSFGPGWASTIDQRVVIAESEIRFALDDGRILRYPVPVAPKEQVMPSRGPRWPLAWDRESDTVTVKQGDLGRTLHFPLGSAPGTTRPLATITDRAGNEIRFDRNADGALAGVRHSGGYHVKVGSQPTPGGIRVTSLALANPAGGGDIPVREFRYDTRGHLTGVVNSSGLPLTFDYDDQGRITRWEDRNGFEYRYTYRTDGRVVRAEGTGGFLGVTLDYDLDARTTTATDASGHATVHHWNDRLQAYKVVNPLGHESRTERDSFGHVIAVTDGLGRTTRIERDGNGDPVRVTRPDGVAMSVRFNEARQPAETTGPDGKTWRYAYGPAGWLTEKTDPAGAVTRFEHDERGRLTSVTDELGNVTRVICNAAGLPVEVTDPLGNRTAYQRDAFGRITEISDPLGAVTRLTWNGNGKLRGRVRPDGTAEACEYDPEGNLLSYTGPGGRVTRFEYGPFDQPVRQVDPDGAVYQFAYTPQLQLESVTNAAGGTWRYELDPVGNLIAETDFNGGRQVYEHDAAGQLIARVGQAGQRITYERDALGLIVGRASGPDRYRYAHDPSGRLVHAEGPGAVLDYTRDAVGRILAETVNGRTVETRYDAAGRRTGRTTPSGAASEWAYDPAGRATRLRVSDDTLEFAYDSAGNETSRRLGPLAALTQSFDVAGRLAGQGIWALDRAESRVGPAPETPGAWHAIQERSYAYGAHGLPVEIDDRLRGPRRFTLDPMGRVTGVQAAGWREEYAYDALGNITASQVPDGDSGPGTSGTRDIDGVLVRRAGRARYEHDTAGRLIRQTRRTLSGQVKTWTYTWDADDQLISVTTPSKDTWHYTYDPLGRRVAKQRMSETGEAAGETWFSWDGFLVAEQGRSATDGSTSILTWDYQDHTFTPVAQTIRTIAGTPDQEETDRRFFSIVADLAGTPQELITPGGELAWQTTTSVWGQVISAPGSDIECPLRFPGQYHDEETGFHYNLNRYYDPATSRYISPDPLGLTPGPNPAAYVDNPFTELDPLGLAPDAATTEGHAPSFIADASGKVQDVRGLGRPDNQLVFSGHGGPADGTTVVPPKTSIAFYGRGPLLKDEVGNEIETGNPTPVKIFNSGDDVPNYTLTPPTGLRVLGMPRTVTVTTPTKLSDLMKPNMGLIHWAACRPIH